MTYEELPFSGIATFFKAPYLPAPTTADADVAVVGVPWDQGTTSRSGARMGPRALRETSTMWAFQQDHEPLYDGEAGVELLGGVRWADSGDVPIGPMWSPERYHNAVVDKLQPIMDSGLFPVTLGGDHSVTLATQPDLSRIRHDKWTYSAKLLKLLNGLSQVFLFQKVQIEFVKGLENSVQRFLDGYGCGLRVDQSLQ